MFKKFWTISRYLGHLEGIRYVSFTFFILTQMFYLTAFSWPVWSKLTPFNALVNYGCFADVHITLVVDVAWINLFLGTFNPQRLVDSVFSGLIWSKSSNSCSVHTFVVAGGKWTQIFHDVPNLHPRLSLPIKDGGYWSSCFQNKENLIIC